MGEVDDLFGSVFAPSEASTSVSQGEATSPAATGGDWFVVIEGNQIGPIDLTEIQARWGVGELSGDSLVWRPTMSEWLPIDDVPDLNDLPRHKPAVAATAMGLATPSQGALGPAPEVEITWRPSAASELSSLVELELGMTSPMPSATVDLAAPVASYEQEDGGDDAAVPGFGGVSLFPSQAQGTDPFASGSGMALAIPTGLAPQAWSMPMPSVEPQGRHPMHLMLWGMGVIIALLIGAIVLLLVMGPPTRGALPVVAEVSPTTPDSKKESGTEPTTALAPLVPLTKATDPAPEPVPVPVPAPAPAPAPAPTAAAPRSPAKPHPKRPPPPPKEELDVKDIVAGVKKNARAVGPCVYRAQKNLELLPGRYKMILDWHIQPDGSVTSARVRGPPKILATSLPRCFVAAMNGEWKFPPSKAGAPVKSFPFGPFRIR